MKNWIYKGICFFDKGEVDGWGATFGEAQILLNKSFILMSLGLLLGIVTEKQL